MDHVLTHERIITELDHTRVRKLLARTGRADSPAAESMEDILEASDVVPSPAVPATVVTMYSRVLLEDLGDGHRTELTLCYPPDADASSGHVSVLSPVGSALLGLREGAVARWRTTTGEERAARILALLFQPEATGDYLR